MSANGSATAPVAPTQGTPTPASQPAAAGQGQQGGGATGQAAGNGGFNWDLFPDVPETQRELLEPHLRNVQGHVTRMEQQYAPYKGLMDQVGADDVGNLVGFLQQYSNDPVATVLGLIANLQETGRIDKGVAMDQLQAMFTGQALQAAEPQAQPGQQEQIPEWAQQLQAKLQQQEAAEQQQNEAREAQESEALVEQAKTEIRGQLTQSGISEEAVSDDLIVAAIIACDGDVSQAVLSLGNMRDKLLGDFTQGKSNGAARPVVAGTIPQGQPPKRSGNSRDGFKQASIQAKQHLLAAQQGAAQGN